MKQGHAILGMTELWFTRGHARSISAVERTVALNPNSAFIREVLAIVLCLSGRPVDSLAEIELALRLNPLSSPMTPHALGRIYLTLGRYDEAVPHLRRLVDTLPANTNGWLMLAACYAALDRRDDAEAAVRQILRINPAYCLLDILRLTPYARQEDMDNYTALLRKAGLPN